MANQERQEPIVAESRIGRRLALSPARKLIMEMVHHAGKVPSFPQARHMCIREAVEARAAHAAPPTWFAIFMKAYALVARRHPELRRAFIPWPRPHLYEHPHSECSFVVERDWEGEKVVLGAKVRAPEEKSLQEITSYLRDFQKREILEVSSFRQLLRLGRLPALIRRFVFWQSLYLSGYKRAKRMGTFMLSSLGQFGSEQSPHTCLTTYATFGPISPDGHVTARVSYDHRVMDGRTLARCLVDLESVLRDDIAREIKESARLPQAA
jgi:pyruvate/2-oxoglutarate dehydrogenase complex dihydrolipoamide acyltransferase (E2) component